MKLTEEQENSIVIYNKLIAEYLGYKYYPYNYPWSKDNHEKDPGWKVHENVSSMSKMRRSAKDYLCRNNNELVFHSNWNWLYIVINELFVRHGFIVYTIVDTAFVYHQEDFSMLANNASANPKHFCYSAKADLSMVILATWECVALCVNHIMINMDAKIPEIKIYKPLLSFIGNIPPELGNKD